MTAYEYLRANVETLKTVLSMIEFCHEQSSGDGIDGHCYAYLTNQLKKFISNGEEVLKE